MSNLETIGAIVIGLVLIIAFFAYLQMWRDQREAARKAQKKWSAEMDDAQDRAEELAERWDALASRVEAILDRWEKMDRTNSPDQR